MVEFNVVAKDKEGIEASSKQANKIKRTIESSLKRKGYPKSEVRTIDED